ncbi:hypothetical protein BN871_KF_00060 [Paenibacillus sp. P22]|nr:hypothetical protein BN871_KF_00060 [Paenibacillus sp. P22]
MHHAAAENLEPARLLAHPAAAAAALRAGHVDLGARLGEREEARAQSDAGLTAEHFLHELEQRSLEIAHADAFGDDKAFDLVELEAVRRIVVVAAVYFAGADDLERSFAAAGLHRADLHRGCLRAHQDVLGHVERVLHIARRMVFRQVERLEVVVVGFDFRSFRDGITEADENILDLLLHLHERMDRARRQPAARQRHVDRLRAQPRIRLGAAVSGAFLFQHGLDRAAHIVRELSDDRTLLGAQRAHPAQNFRQRAFFAQILDSEISQLLRAGYLLQLLQRFGAQRLQPFLHGSHASLIKLLVETPLKKNTKRPSLRKGTKGPWYHPDSSLLAEWPPYPVDRLPCLLDG